MLHMNTLVDTLQMPLVGLQGYLKIKNLGLYVQSKRDFVYAENNLDNTTARGIILSRPFGLNSDND